MDTMERASEISRFLFFMRDMREALAATGTRADEPAVKMIRSTIEDHYLDDQGKPAMYLTMASALYDDAPAIVNLWKHLENYDAKELRRYRRLIGIELDGLNGDRHPRKVFDRSPFGVAALIVGTITIWMTFLNTYPCEELGELLKLIRFNWIVA